MKKKLLRLLLGIAVLFSAMVTYVPTQAASLPAWKTAYIKKIGAMKKKVARLEVSLFDMDKDGIPEMMVDCFDFSPAMRNDYTDKYNGIYTYKNGKCYKIKTQYPTGDSVRYYKRNIIMSRMLGHIGDTLRVAVLYKKNGKVYTRCSYQIKVDTSTGTKTAINLKNNQSESYSTVSKNLKKYGVKIKQEKYGNFYSVTVAEDGARKVKANRYAGNDSLYELGVDVTPIVRLIKNY